MDQTQGRIAVLHRIHDDPHGDQVVDLLQLLVLLDQLFVDAVQMLWPAADLGLDPGGGQLLLHGGDHRVQGAHVLRLLGGDGALELTVFLRPDVHKAQVFQLALDGPHAEPVGQGRVNLQGLLGLADALFLAAIFQGAHIVEPVRQLDDHHPHVLGDGQEHLAQVLRLGFLPGHQLPVTGLGQLGDPVHHLGDVSRLIADALHVRDHLQGGGDGAQIPGITVWLSMPISLSMMATCSGWM